MNPVNRKVVIIRYTLEPNRLKHFRDYVEHELEPIRNAGGKIVGYWLPTDFAGPTNIAYGLIDFVTLPSACWGARRLPPTQVGVTPPMHGIVSKVPVHDRGG